MTPLRPIRSREVGVGLGLQARSIRGAAANKDLLLAERRIGLGLQTRSIRGAAPRDVVSGGRLRGVAVGLATGGQGEDGDRG
jgi:hypothetical protein